MIVVGITGWAGAGKDSVADILVAKHGFVKMSFADPIKDHIRKLDPIIGFDQYPTGCVDDCGRQEVEEVRLSDAEMFGFKGDSIKESPWAEEVRSLWQRYGTEVHRAEGEDFWVERALNKMFDSGHERIVLPDVRFPNEAEAIYELRRMPISKWTEDGWVMSAPLHFSSLWRVARPGFVPDLHDEVHSSEQHVGMLGEEVVILNNDTLEDLDHPVDIAVQMLLDGNYPGDQLWGPASFDLDPVRDPTQYLKVAE